jgi:hypothetical protein
VATLSGLGNNPSTCALFGSTLPLTAEQLEARYGDHGGFVAAWTQATQRAAQSGFIRPEDARDLAVVGAESDILRSGGTTSG